MKDRPILFSGPMVQALLNGSKTQTRRIVKPQPDWTPEVHSTEVYGPFVWPMAGAGRGHQCGAPLTKLPYGMRGDLLVVRETFRLPAEFDDRKLTLVRPDVPVWYEADGRADEGWGKTRVSIHMPRWASRLTLEITEVRVERLNAISEADATAEGVLTWARERTMMEYSGKSDALLYRELWAQINGTESWDANPWVWAVSFRVHQQNIDTFGSAA
jgi:hypothetical protein